MNLPEEEVKKLKALKRTRANAAALIEATCEKIQACIRDEQIPNRNWMTIQEDGLVQELHEFKLTVTAYSELLDLEVDSEYQKLYLDVREARSQLANLIPETTTEISVRSAPVSLNRAKLPKVEIPVFKGDLEKWISFAQLFIANIDQDETIHDAVKLMYLKSYLQDEPAQLIQGFDIVDANYLPAWEVLRARYDNTRVAKSHYFKVLMNLPEAIRELSSLKQLLNKVTVSVDALSAHGLSLGTFGDEYVAFQVLTKLDFLTRKTYETTQEEYSLEAVKLFLQKEIQALEAIGPRTDTRKPSSTKVTDRTFRKGNRFGVAKSFMSTSGYQPKCTICGESHWADKCKKLIDVTPSERYGMVKEKGLCILCLGTRHSVQMCTRKGKECLKCSRRHHTLLHVERNSNIPVRPAPAVLPARENANPVAAVASMGLEQIAASATDPTVSDSYVLLRTASVQVKDVRGNMITCRALLDGGSQPEFVTTRLVERLGYAATQSKASVAGIGCMSSTTVARVSINLYNQYGAFCSSFTARVIDQITSNLPHVRVNISDPVWDYAAVEKLADPYFHQPGEIDILLGGRVMSEIALHGFKRGPQGYPTLFRTTLGWSIGGPVPVPCMETPPVTCHALDDYLPKFWETEDIPERRELTPEEKICEDHFQKTCTRLPDGRFLVDVPLRADRRLGESKLTAFRQFLSLERRGVPDEYREFMNEYKTLGHMSERDPEVLPGYYMPHHAVYKDEKIRVVFNASSKTSSGYSFNDLQYTGPVVQRDIFQVLLIFRSYKYVFTCDICKMYRQIRVVEKIQNYQIIFWRDTKAENIKEYALETVTYGTTSASYLATKCLMKLAEEERHNTPAASKAVRNNSYMDDICTGADDIAGLECLRLELVGMLSKADLNLAKWQSNCPQLLATIPESERGIVKNLNVEARALGLEWRAKEDAFAFGIRAETRMQLPVTKRKLLSRLARVFDPLGLIAPVVVTGKYLVQLLWYLERGWDEPLSDDQTERYTSYIVSLEQIRNIKIPRYLCTTAASNSQLIGFADASEMACAAAVYMRVKTKNGFEVNLICSKTKIASLRKKQTIPRLELNAAVLLAELANQLSELFGIPPDRNVLFTDSTITLAWIRKSPAVLKTYVANRVSRIQTMVPVECWHHVVSEENAADIASRGCSPSALMANSAWWHGPEFLSRSFELTSDVVPDGAEVQSECREIPSPVDVVREPSAAHVNVNQSPVGANVLLDLINRTSSYNKLVNVIAFCIRFSNNTRKLHLAEDAPFLTCFERNHAINVICRSVQLLEYRSIIMSLFKKQPVPVKHPLASLNPFLDSDGVLRVGGRLRNAEIVYDQKHPIILPSKHRLTSIVIQYIHQKYLHPGPSLTTQFVRMKFWICPNGRSVIRKITRTCVNCLRYRKVAAGQIMGQLPETRVRPVAPFTVTGVDYAGPITIAQHQLETNQKIRLKAYIAVFVCFATKAVHVELATDLSMDTFIAVFRRFIARRGVPSEIWSDNGTNFTAASNELQVLYNFQRENFDVFSRYFAAEGIRWRFIPPRTPHMGGLWESTVKSVKTHLRVMLGTYLLSYEELNTLLIQIEGCLNSRPLTKLSEDAENLDVLTPGHFLVGRPVLSLPEPTVEIAVNFEPNDVKERWRLLQHIFTIFWKKYKLEYLSTLQQRNKWKVPESNLKVDDIVLLKEYSPPADWSLARIMQICPDGEGNVRLVVVRTRGEEKTVHVKNVVPLLLELE